MPKVSVITATRNRSELLTRCIASARNAGTDVEIVVVDDASDDGTASVCESSKVDGFVRLRHQLGLGGARNVGLIASTSPYVTFLDDDDVRLPGSIDTQVQLLEARPDAGMIYGKALYGDQEGNTNGDFYPDRCPQGDIFWELMTWNFIPCPTVVFRRDCLTRLGLLDEAARGIEDWDLWIRIAEIYPVLALDETVAIWRRPTADSDQFTSIPDAMHTQIRRLHRDKWMRLPRVAHASDDVRRQAAGDFANHATQQLIWESADCLKNDRSSDFVRIALALLRLYPLGVWRKAFDSSTRRSLLKLGRQAPDAN